MSYHCFPLFGTLGVLALLAGPAARLPIDLGAWLLGRLFPPPGD